MPYFQANDGYDLLLLHSSVRTHAEVKRTAVQVEAEIAAFYTERLDSDFYSYTEGIYTYSVMLRGYDADVTAATGYATDRTQWTGFADAFRRTVANVTSWRLRTNDDNRGMKREAIDGYSYERQSALDDDWPVNWQRHLWPYDERTPVFV